MEKIVVDTDVIIDFLRGHKKRIREVFVEIERKELKAYLSCVSVVELYAGQSSSTNGNLDALSQLLSFFEIIPLETDLARFAGILKRKYGTGLADSIIASSAIMLEAFLLTFNTKHFTRIPDLTLYSLA